MKTCTSKSGPPGPRRSDRGTSTRRSTRTGWTRAHGSRLRQQAASSKRQAKENLTNDMGYYNSNTITNLERITHAKITRYQYQLQNY